MNTEIKIENLSKNYGKKQALCGVNLTIEKGMFGLLGRNGAGKTTLMKILTSLLPKTSGSITMCGVPIEQAKQVREMVGYLPQDFSMYPNMAVGEAMDYLGVLSGLPAAVRKERIPKLLYKVNLQDDVRKKVKELSGGMKRRLGIAQAILHDPQVIIVDEPTAGLDPEERVRFRNLLSEIAEERIVILSTHIVGDVEATCENIAVLNEGVLLYQGSVADFIKSVEGKVYSAQINHRELAEMKRQFIVTSMLTLGNNAVIRFIAEQKPFAEAKSIEAGVEDAYMYLMHQVGGGVL